MIYPIIILAVAAWWIAEGSNLVQLFKWRVNKKFDEWDICEIKRVYVFDCPKCLGFWMGVGYVWFIGLDMDTLPIPILVSALSIFISKVYDRIKL